MLTIQSYLTAMLLYWAAAVIGLVLMRRLWFSMPLKPAGGAILGLIGGLLLAPAFPGPETQSMAPALIIVVFLILRRTSSSSEVSANESYSKQEKLSKENEHYLPTDV